MRNIEYNGTSKVLIVLVILMALNLWNSVALKAQQAAATFHSTNVAETDLGSRVELPEMPSYPTLDRGLLALQDTLLGQDTLKYGPEQRIFSSNIVYSERTLETQRDSLLQNGLIAKPEDIRPMDRQHLIRRLREWNEGVKGKVMRYSSDGDLPSNLLTPDTERTAIGAMENPSEMIDDLCEKSFQDLQYLKGYRAKVPLLDDIKSKELRKVKSKVKTSAVGEIQKIIVQPKVAFKDRWSIDGVMGLSGSQGLSEQRLLQFSPAFSYRISGPFSVGVGPDAQFFGEKNQEGKQRISCRMGLRTFAKVALFENRTYLQLEDIYSPPDTPGNRHRIYAGAGYLLQFSDKMAFNVSLLYQTNTRKQEFNNAPSPWLFRLGLSAFR